MAVTSTACPPRKISYSDSVFMGETCFFPSNFIEAYGDGVMRVQPARKLFRELENGRTDIHNHSAGQSSTSGRDVNA
jgi:hypothetical protein